MAHKRRIRLKRKRLPAPDDVLAGRVEAGPEELFDLIHEVNPTGKKTSPAETARRYRTKSRLQSLLIRRHGDEHLAVVAEPGRPNVVSLEHRAGLRDACHAVLSELDDDARAWARRQLDLAAMPEPEEPELRLPGDDDAPRTAAEVLALGRKALETYDYETAETLANEAFERTAGGVDAARLLLEVWVGHLGLDRQALALAPRLGPAARDDQAVRARLALAAARCDETARALELVAGVEATAAAEVFARLAAHAVDRGDRAAARRHLAALRERDPVHPEIPGLEDRIAELRAASLRPAEEALAERCRAEGPLAVEDEARALSRRWPESEVARDVLRRAAELRRRETIADSLARAAAARAEQRFDDEARLLRRARDAGCDQPDLDRRIAAAERRAQEHRERRLLADALARFDDPDPRPALLGYLALPPALRAAVRRQIGRPALDWLEAAGAPSSSARAQAAVAGVLALEQAAEALAGGDAETALELVGPHRRALRGVDAARELEEQAAERAAEQRRAARRETLERARRALDAGRLDAAGRHLRELELAGPEPRERRRIVALRQRLRRAQELARLAAEVERRRAEGDLLGAVAGAERLAREADDEDARARWRRRVGELESELEAGWRLEVATGPRPASRLHDVLPWVQSDSPKRWLDDRGRLLLTAAWGRWLFLRRVRPDPRRPGRSEIVEQVSLRTPEALEKNYATFVDRDRLTVVDRVGTVLELALPAWKIAGWRRLAPLLPRGARLETSEKIADTPYFWLTAKRHKTDWSLLVVDGHSWSVVHRDEDVWIVPVLGLPEPAVVTAGVIFGARLRRPDGKPTEDGALPVVGRVSTAAVGPDGDGLLVPDEHRHFDEKGDLMVRRLRRATGTWTETAALELTDGDYEASYYLATALEPGLAFLLYPGTDGARDLVALRDGADGLELVYRVPVPPATLLAADRGARRAVMIATGEDAAQVVTLGPEPPALEPWPEDPPGLEAKGFVPVLGPFFCGPTAAGGDPDAVAISQRLPYMGGGDLEGFMLRFDSRDDDHMTELLALTLEVEGKRGRTREQIDMLRGFFSTDHELLPVAAVLAATRKAETGDWDVVLRILRRADPAGLDPRRGRHFRHLQALALMRQRRFRAARRALRRGLELNGDCPLETLLAFLELAPEPADRAPDRPLNLRLMGMILAADEALEAGEPRAAVEVLERPVLWHTRELHSAARLAAAYLALPARTASERFDRRFALAFFTRVHDHPTSLRRELLHPAVCWPRRRIDALARRAARWLDGAPEPGAAAPGDDPVQ